MRSSCRLITDGASASTFDLSQALATAIDYDDDELIPEPSPGGPPPPPSEPSREHIGPSGSDNYSCRHWHARAAAAFQPLAGACPCNGRRCRCRRPVITIRACPRDVVSQRRAKGPPAAAAPVDRPRFHRPVKVGHHQQHQCFRLSFVYWRNYMNNTFGNRWRTLIHPSHSPTLAEPLLFCPVCGKHAASVITAPDGPEGSVQTTKAGQTRLHDSLAAC